MSGKAFLGDVCQITMGQAPPGDSYNEKGHGLPLVAGAGDFAGAVPRVKKFTSAPSKISQQGDIILGIRASIGERVWSDRPYCLGRGVAGLRPSEKLDPNYLWHWLGHSADHLKGKGRGATFLQVNRADISEMEIPLPPLGEQHRIATILEQADTLRAKRHEVRTDLNDLSESLFMTMFGDLHDEPLGPKLAFLTSGGRGWAKYYADTGKPFIRSLDVQMDRMSTQDLAVVDAPDNAEARRTRTRLSDVLLTITGSRIGRAAPLPDDLAGAYVSQHVAILRPQEDALLPEFLSTFLCSKSFGQRQILAAQYGQTKPGLNFDQIRDFRIPSANLSQQCEFRSRIETVRQLESDVRRAEHELEALCASLQCRAFSGQL